MSVELGDYISNNDLFYDIVDKIDSLRFLFKFIVNFRVKFFSSKIKNRIIRVNKRIWRTIMCIKWNNVNKL